MLLSSLIVVGSVLLLLGLLWWLVPKGTALHELLHLPLLWRHIFSHPIAPYIEETYRYGEHPDQYILFLRSRGVALQKGHLLVYFHGGAWRVGRPEQFRANAQVFMEQGYGVIMPSYRKLPKVSFREIREDLNDVLRMILKIQQEHGLEDKKLLMGGVSAGGHLAACMIYQERYWKALGMHKAQFAGLFCFGTPLDFRKMKASKTLKRLVGQQGNPRFSDANPTEQLPQNTQVPVLCLHSTKDGLVESASSEAFVAQLQQIDASLIEFHWIIGTHLDVCRWPYQDDEVRQYLLQWLARREEAIA